MDNIFLNTVFCQIVCYLAELLRQIVCYLAKLFRQIVCYLAELFRQIAFPFFFLLSHKDQYEYVKKKIGKINFWIILKGCFTNKSCLIWTKCDTNLNFAILLLNCYYDKSCMDWTDNCQHDRCHHIFILTCSTLLSHGFWWGWLFFFFYLLTILI